jgi:hypothetical protein
MLHILSCCGAICSGPSGLARLGTGRARRVRAGSRQAPLLPPSRSAGIPAAARLRRRRRRAARARRRAEAALLPSSASRASCRRRLLLVGLDHGGTADTTCAAQHAQHETRSAQPAAWHSTAQRVLSAANVQHSTAKHATPSRGTDGSLAIAALAHLPLAGIPGHPALNSCLLLPGGCPASHARMHMMQ